MRNCFAQLAHAERPRQGPREMRRASRGTRGSPVQQTLVHTMASDDARYIVAQICRAAVRVLAFLLR
jgi:hypothetical protein